MKTKNGATKLVNDEEQENVFCEEIQRALEMMRRARASKVADLDDLGNEAEGNRYILPEPLVLRTNVS